MVRTTRVSRTLRLAAVAVACTVLASACSGDDGATATITTDPTNPSDAASSTAAAGVARALVVPATVTPFVAPTATTVPGPDTVALEDLVVGDCIDIADAEGETVEVGMARRRACAEPHGLEVIHVGSLNDDPAAAYPGDEAVLGGADQMCLGAFATYVGREYVDSSLEIAHLRPDEPVWILGDRVVRCVVQDRLLEPLVGSVKDSGR